MEAVNEFFGIPIFGVPLLIWIVFWKYYVIGYFPTWLWGFWFYDYLWNPDYMKEVIGEELYNKLT